MAVFIGLEIESKITYPGERSIFLRHRTAIRVFKKGLQKLSNFQHDWGGTLAISINWLCPLKCYVYHYTLFCDISHTRLWKIV